MFHRKYLNRPGFCDFPTLELAVAAEASNLSCEVYQSSEMKVIGAIQKTLVPTRTFVPSILQHANDCATVSVGKRIANEEIED